MSMYVRRRPYPLSLTLSPTGLSTVPCGVLLHDESYADTERVKAPIDLIDQRDQLHQQEFTDSGISSIDSWPATPYVCKSRSSKQLRLVNKDCADDA
jgi:hypothetical protein